MIVKGYKGIMDLDLSNIHPVFHKSLIEQHKKDIEKYKLYQQTLEPELRYENAIELVLKKRAFYSISLSAFLFIRNTVMFMLIIKMANSI